SRCLYSPLEKYGVEQRADTCDIVRVIHIHCACHRINDTVERLALARHTRCPPPSATVVVMNLSVVCRANIWRSLGASGAMRTKPEYAQRAAVWRARDPRRGAESRRHSAGYQPARGLEGCQTARRGALRHFFLG